MLHIFMILYTLTKHALQFRVVSSPDPPSTLQLGKGGLVNIVQHFCRSGGISAEQSDWLMWQISHLYYASLVPRPPPSFPSLAVRQSGGGPGTFPHVSDVTDRANYTNMGNM